MSSTTEVIDCVPGQERNGGPLEVVNGLTPRQREVLALIGQGLSTAEIANRLYRTVKTIESHRLSLGKRLGARNRVELARIAIQSGLCELPAGGRNGNGESNGAASQSCAAVCRALEILDEEADDGDSRSCLDSLMSQLIRAFDGTAAFISRCGPDRMARSVVCRGVDGPIQEFSYAMRNTMDADLRRGEVRGVVGFAPAPGLAPGASLVTGLFNSRGERLGTMAVMLSSRPDEVKCPKQIMRLLAGRAAAELERREIEERVHHLHSLLTTSGEHIGILERNLQTDRLAWSSETYRILGLKPESVSPTREQFFSRVHPEDRDAAERACDEAVRLGTGTVVDYRVVRPDGGIRRILARYEVASDVAGNPGWLIGTLRDVTDD